MEEYLVSLDIEDAALSITELNKPELSDRFVLNISIIFCMDQKPKHKEETRKLLFFLAKNQILTPENIANG